MPLLENFDDLTPGPGSFGQNVSSKRRGAIGAGLESGYEDIKGLGYNTLAAGADVIGATEARDWLEKKAKEKEYASFVASRPELERVEDQNLGSALPFAGYQIAKQVPNLVGAVGMGMLAPEVAVPSALARGGALLPRALGGGGFSAAEGYAARKAAVEAGQTFGKQVVGGAAFNEAQAVGSLYQSAREGGDPNAGRTALLASPAYAISETLPEAMMVGRLAHGSGFSGNLLSRMAKSGGIQAGTGATSEILQTGMEQAVGKKLTPEESRSQYLNAGVIGGLVEGVLGTTGGFRAKSSILPGGNEPAAVQGAAPSNDVAQTFAQNDRTTPDSIMAGLTGGSALTGVSRDPLAGRSKLVPPVIGPTSVPRPEVPALNPEAARANPPAVAGGSTDVAQQTQAQFMQQQQAQQEQANQAARDKTFQTLGAQYSPETGGQLNIFGAQLFGDAKINAFGNTLAAKLNALPPVAHQIADAVAQAHELTGNLVSLKLDGGNPIGSADKVMKALAKTTDKFQIGHVQSVEQAADILESLSKTAKGNDLDQGNAIHYALTGRETSGYIASQQSKAEKGAKNVQQPKLQTTTGVGEVPVQGGAGEAGNGGAGPVRPAQVEPIGAGGLGEGSLGLQTGQLPAEGIRAGASGNAVTNDVDQSKAREEINDLLQKVFGGTRPEGEFNETENTTEAGAGVGPTGQSGQAKKPTVVTATSEGNGGPRKYEIPAQYYNTDIMHIRPERRQQIINEVLGGALTPEVDRENTVSQEDRVDIVRLSLLEDMTAPDIAIELDLETATVDQQRRRLGIRLGTYGLEIDQSTEAGRKFMASLMLSAENFRSPEFPDGIGAKEFAGLYSAKDLYYDKGKFQHMGKPVEEEQEEGEQPAVTTDVKLQEELKNKPESEAATQSAGQIKTAGGSQGNIDALKKSRKNKETGERVLDIGALDQITNLEAEADRIRDALEDMAPKDPRRSALLDRLDAIGDVDSGELGALWGQYAKAQTMRSAAANAQGVKIDKDAEEAAEVTTPTELTGEEITASEREDERRKEAAEKAKADQGEENAIQVKSTDEGNVRKPAGGGEEVGEANAKPKKPARARKAKAEVKPAQEAKQEVKTPEEQWSALADQFPGMPPYESLSKDEKIRWDDVASRGVANLAAANTVLTTTVKAGTAQTPGAAGTSEEVEGKFGKDGVAFEPYSVAELTKEISDFVRTTVNTRKLKIVDSVKDLLTSSDPVEQKLGAVLALNRAYGVATNGRAYLIANRISKGQGRAKFMHEVGVHLGVEGLLPDKQFDTLTDQIFTWAKRDDGSREERLAKKAILRADVAGTPDEDIRSEILAYFVEEAMQDGINPSAAEKLTGPLGSWFRTLWAAFKTAIRRLGMNPEKMNAQDVVNLAYGAARLEMAGTYHGTAANFRKFNHKYMGSGEGAQAYGWGTYLAERFGIAKGYWKADVRRKEDIDPNKGNPVTRFFGLSPLAKPEGNVMRVDIGVDQNELLNWDTKLSKQPAILAKAEANIPESLKQSLADETDLDLGEMTGEDLYRGLEFLEKKEGRVSEEFDVDNYNKRLANKRAKEIVSTYLDEVVGIPGLKFYDAESRGKPENEIVFNGKRYGRTDLINMRRDDGSTMPLEQITILRHLLRHGFDATMKELEQKLERNIQRSMDVKKEVNAKYNTPSVESEVREYAERYNKRSYEALQIKFLQENKDNISITKAQDTRTRNLVIFNDKNIFRVGSRGGNERAKMKFGFTEQKISSGEGPFSKAGQWLDSTLTDPKGAMRKVKLGFLTLEQLSDMDTSPNQVVRSYTDISNYMMMTSKELVNRAVKIDHLWAKLTPAMDTKLSEVMRTATRMGFDPALSTDSTEKLSKEEQDLVRLYDSLDKDSQNVYRQVRQHYQDLFEKRKAILESTAAKLGGKELQEVQEMYSKLKGPYFPLGRVGDYYAVGMSPRVAELMDKKEESGLTSAETTELNGLRKQASQYKSSSFKTLREAKEAATKMKKEMGSGYFNEVAERIQEGVAGLPNFAKLEDYITSQLGGETRAEVQNMLSQMMFDMLPEHHALKSAMRREGIHGENENMRQVFAKSSLSQAHYISRLQYGEQLNEALQKVAKAARRDHDMRTIENELKLRAKISMTDSQSALTDLAVNASYFAHLGLSPAFLISNMTQVPMITAPWLYARHGLNNSRMAMAQAIVDSAKIIKSTYKDGDWRSEIDWNQQFPVGSREDRMFRTLLERNALDITVEHDLAAVASANRGFFDDKISKATGGHLGGLGDVVKLVNTPVRVTELANRASTALAAYRLKWAALESAGLSEEDRHRVATDYAARAVSETQLNYSELNAPRYMRSLFGSKPLARLVFQFRKYQQGMLYLVTKNIADAFSGATKEERRIARRTIGGLYATTFLMAGTTGMPLMGTVGLAGIANLIAGMFGDDDEPWDFETEYRNFLTDWLGHDMALLVAKGIPAYLGADVSQRVGLAEIANPVPFVQRGSTGQSMVANTLYAAAGAPVGMVGSAMDGIMQMANGDVLKGVEQVIPLKEAKDLLRSYRYSTEGLTDRRGNVVLPPESFSAWDIAFRGMGFTPTKESEYYAANEAMHTAEQAAKDVRNNLLRRYAEARMNDKDTDAIQEKIDAYNDRHPEKGVRITVSAMLKAVQQRRKMAEERTSSGLRVGKAQRPFAEEARFAEDEEE